MTAIPYDPNDPRLSSPESGKGRLQRIVWQKLLQHEAAGELPTSNRFIFYELEGEGHLRKSRKGESRRRPITDPGEVELMEALVHLRENGLIPWSWLVDETRTLNKWRSAATVAEYVQDSLRYARINPWDGAPPLLLVEDRATAGVLRAMTQDYLVDIAATNGQAGGFLHTVVAPILDDGSSFNDRAILYLGDWDLQGHQIEANTRSVLEREVGYELDWTRIAITQQQIAERGLEPVVKTDNRYRPAREYEAWEAEALGQGAIQQLVRVALDALLPEPLEDVQGREEEQRERVAEVLASIDFEG